MKKNHLFLFTSLILLLSACAPDPDTTLRISTSLKSQSRFEITRTGIVEDDLAYNNRRGIYIIKDTTTGKEYIGVSGVGISEIGSHLVEKVIVEDVPLSIFMMYLQP